MEVFIVLLVIIYITINLRVMKKIDSAYYLKEERRKLHKKFIWMLPFLGPLLIKSFWQHKKNKGSDVMTKSKRKISKWKSTDNWKNLTGWGGGPGV